jgi:hypothetical protein
MADDNVPDYVATETVLAIDHVNAASSLAMAVTATCTCFPLVTSPLYRAQSRSWAFQAISQTLSR